MNAALLVITLVLFAVPVCAETYVWEDEQGTVNFAEDLGKVPKKYRKQAKIAGEEELPPSEPAASKEKAPARSEEKEKTAQKRRRKVFRLHPKISRRQSMARRKELPGKRNFRNSRLI